MVQTNPLRTESVGMVSGSFDTAGDVDCGYVCNGYVLCSKFGRFAKPRLFFIIFILLGLVHGAVETILMKTILASDPVIPYTTTKWIVLGSEILQLISALPIVFWGSQKRRPQWLAGCMASLAVTGFIFASYLLSEYSAGSKHKSYRTQKDTLLCNIWFDNLILKKWSWYWLTVLALFLLHFATGISRIAYWSLGIAYVDDNSLPRSSPFVIGLILALKQFGPFSGLFISYFGTTHFYNGLCWLGVSIVVLIVAFLIGMFPTKMIDNEFRNVSYSDEDSGYFPSLKRIFTNKVIILNGSAMIFVLAVIVNATAIEEEYIESVFYVPSPYYSLFNSILSLRYLFSILKPTIAAFAIFVSGFLIQRIRPRSTILCIWSVICLCVAAACMFCLIFLRCSGTPIHHEDNRKDLLEYCNRDCDCNQVPFTPVCSEYDQFVFYSPCHAGCSSSQGSGEDRVFLDCQCVSSHSVRAGGRCTRGKCTVFYWLYQLMNFIITAAISSGFVGSLVVCLRGVLPTDKSSAIGAMAIISGFAARAPFKFLYDFVTNFGCIYLVGDLCKMYNSEKLTTYFQLMNICFLLIAAGILSLMCFLAEDIALYESVITRASRNKQNVSEPDGDGREMTDFRAQLNQALKNRREVAAEEQQLLGERRNSMSSRQFSENDPAPADEQLPQQLQQHQRTSQGYENGRNSLILSDEKPNSSDKLRASSSNQSSNRDYRPKVLPKPIIFSKPSTSSSQPQNLPSTSSSGVSLPATPDPTGLKAERCLTTPL